MNAVAAPPASVFRCGVGARTATLIAHILGDAHATRLIGADDAPMAGVTVLTGIDEGLDHARDPLILRHLLERPHGAPLVIGIGDVRAGTIARQVAMAGRSEELTKVAPGVCMDMAHWAGLRQPGDALAALCAIAACEALDLPRSSIDEKLSRFDGEVTGALA